MIGQTFQFVTVLSGPDTLPGEARPHYTCQCVCGKVFRRHQTNLRRYKSCGCLRGNSLRFRKPKPEPATSPKPIPPRFINPKDKRAGR